MRVPLVAPEDLRDDIIENAPASHTEEYSGEEKTWMWYVSFCCCARAKGRVRGSTGWALQEGLLEVWWLVGYIYLTVFSCV